MPIWEKNRVRVPQFLARPLREKWGLWPRPPVFWVAQLECVRENEGPLWGGAALQRCDQRLNCWNIGGFSPRAAKPGEGGLGWIRHLREERWDERVTAARLARRGSYADGNSRRVRHGARASRNEFR